MLVSSESSGQPELAILFLALVANSWLVIAVIMRMQSSIFLHGYTGDQTGGQIEETK